MQSKPKLNTVHGVCCYLGYGVSVPLIVMFTSIKHRILCIKG
uniref:Uncharacterized protein n=1 Tax=Arundo donax TaxID=35708 RepID=A0A0A8YN84_ARUDO